MERRMLHAQPAQTNCATCCHRPRQGILYVCEPMHGACVSKSTWVLMVSRGTACPCCRFLGGLCAPPSLHLSPVRNICRSLRASGRRRICQFVLCPGKVSSFCVRKNAAHFRSYTWVLMVSGGTAGLCRRSLVCVSTYVRTAELTSLTSAEHFPER